MGQSILDKVQEILETGKLQKLENFNADPVFSLRSELAKVWGIGPETANKLIRKGYRSVDDLRKRGWDDLTEQQRVGLKHFDDLQHRIPREEVVLIEGVVRETIQALVGKELECMTCGSYRRGRSHCGDVDVLIRAMGDNPPLGLLLQIIQELESKRFLVDHFSLPSKVHRDKDDAEYMHHASYMGICRLNEQSRCRHIDIKVYNEAEFPFALLYFTGSDYFNRSMRTLAHTKGYSLTDTVSAGYLRNTRYTECREFTNACITTAGNWFLRVLVCHAFQRKKSLLYLVSITRLLRREIVLTPDSS